MNVPARSGAGCPLSRRELEVLGGAAGGLTARALGDRFGMARQTAKNVLCDIFRKLGVSDRTGAVVVALQRGWLSLDAITVAPRESPPE